MRWPARFRTDERGFTLVELMVGMVDRHLADRSDRQRARRELEHDGRDQPTDVREPRRSDHVVLPGERRPERRGRHGRFRRQLFRRVHHAGDVHVLGTRESTHAEWAARGVQVWDRGGETQVTRTFNGATVVVAHFAGATRPDITVAYDPSQPTVPVSVKMTFTKGSDCTLDCSYTLFGARRSFNPATAGAGSSPIGDVVLLSTGTSSPLWVQGSCPNGGTDPTTDCFSDPQTIALPTADVTTTGWTPSPASPSSLFDKLNDRSDATWISTIARTRSRR